jgi:predicted O-linked N-acetylglucosamine transferase (SPINDLY family)
MNLGELLEQGHSLHRAGRFAEAEQVYRKVLLHAPGSFSVLGDLAWALQQQGQHQSAVEAMRQAIAANPDGAAYWNDLGVMFRSSGDIPAAIESFQQAIRLNPQGVEAHYNLGNTYAKSGQHQLAIPHYENAAKVAPQDADVQMGLGAAHKQLGRMSNARECFERAVNLDPTRGDAWKSLGLAVRFQGELERAVECFEHAVKCRPSDSVAHMHLGAAWRACNRLDQAIAAFQMARQLVPDNPQPLRSLAEAYETQGDTQLARQTIDQALAVGADDGLRIRRALLLPVIIESRQGLLESRQRLTSELETLAAAAVHVSDPLESIGSPAFPLAYHGLNERETQSRIASIVRNAAPDLSYVAPHCDQRGAGDHSRIRVGFISSNFRDHTIGKLNAGLVARLDRTRFEVIVFRCGASADKLAKFIDAHADQTCTLPYNLLDSRRQVAEHRVDVLVYTDIGLDPMTYYLAYARLAPVQCTTWGHPLTTGISTVDYFISSEDLETPRADCHYTERLARLPRLANYYYRPQHEPSEKTRDDFPAPPDATWYGCLQSLFKLHPDDDEVFGQILRRDPRGVLLLLEGNFPAWTERTRRRLQASIPDVFHRVYFVPQQRPFDFARLLALCDVLLDPMHFGGGETSYQSFAVGTPIVTLPGEFLRSRITYALYRAMGLSNCIATDKHDLVERAVRLGADPAWRESVRREILTANSAIFENEQAVRAFEDFLHTIAGRH